MNESEQATDQSERTSLVFLFTPCNFLQEILRAILKCFGVSKTEDQNIDPSISISHPDEKNAPHDCQSQDSTGSQSSTTTTSSECPQQQEAAVPPSTDDDESFACPPPTYPTNPDDPPTQNPDFATGTTSFIRAAGRSKRPPITKGRGGQIN